MASMVPSASTASGSSVQCEQRTLAASASADGPRTSAMIANSARDRPRQCGGMTLPDPPRANQRDSHPLRHALTPNWLSAIGHEPYADELTAESH